jgi:hypothetical protein
MVKVFLTLTKHHATEMYGGAEVQIHTFFTSELYLGERLALSFEQRACDTNWIGS